MRGGSCAVFAWSDLFLDRSRKLVGLQSPAAAPRVRVAPRLPLNEPNRTEPTGSKPELAAGPATCCRTMEQ